jgi:hypothetical protein
MIVDSNNFVFNQQSAIINGESRNPLPSNEKRIALAFFSDRGRWAMAWDHYGIIRQSQHGAA